MLPDLSPSLTLDDTQRVRYAHARRFVYLAFVLFIFWFAYTLMFPVRTFSFDASIDSLANTITRPTTSALGTTFDVAHPFNVNRALVTFSLPTETVALPDEAILQVSKSYASFLAPLSTDTSRDDRERLDAPFPDGSLISSPSGVFVTSGDTRIPFDTEQTLLASGYTFDTVSESSSEQRATYSKARIFSMRSAHPDGTRFHTTDTDQAYLFSNQKLTATPHQEDLYHIPVQFAARSTFAKCNPTRHILRRNTYSCVIDLAPITTFDGKRYTFTFADLPSVELAKINLSFDTEPTGGALRDRITEMSHLFRKNTQ